MTLAFPKSPSSSIPAPIAAPVPPAAQTPARTFLPAGETRKLRTTDTNYLAHDARNWLTVLQVYCDLLRTSGAVADGYQNWIEELSSAVERGHGLVASLLDSAGEASPMSGPLKSTLGDFDPDDSDPEVIPDRRWPAATIAAPMAESLDLAAAITRRLPLLRGLAGGQIHVEIDVPANAGKVALSESTFERILHNLVSNAIEAMPQGGRLRIALRRGNRPIDRPSSAVGPESLPFKRSKSDARPGTFKAGAWTDGDRRSGRTSQVSASPTFKTLLLRVHDTGDGIQPEHLRSIFEVGVSGKTAREDDAQPRGFGLAIVRELTQRAGGAVRVRSHPGSGSCFEIELPRI